MSFVMKQTVHGGVTLGLPPMCPVEIFVHPVQRNLQGFDLINHGQSLVHDTVGPSFQPVVDPSPLPIQRQPYLGAIVLSSLLLQPAVNPRSLGGAVYSADLA